MRTPGEEIAWAAGLFEGEGCMTRSGSQKVMRLVSTDEDTVRRFWEIVAVGKVYGPYEQGPCESRFGSGRRGNRSAARPAAADFLAWQAAESASK